MRPNALALNPPAPTAARPRHAECAPVGFSALLDRTLDACIHACIPSTVADFEWDEEKAKRNLEKHGIDFADAVTVMNDTMALTMPDPASDEDERFVTLGVDALGRLLVVGYTWREDRIRPISARKATRRERRQYEGKRS